MFFDLTVIFIDFYTLCIFLMQFWKYRESATSNARDFHNRVRSKHTTAADIWAARDQRNPGKTSR